MKRNAIKKMGMSDRTFNILVTTLLTVFLLLVLYPLIYVISASFSSGDAVSSGKVILWPVDISLTGYKLVFRNKEVWVGYANTIFYVFFRTIYSVALNILVSYVFSRNDFFAKKFFTIFWIIPIWFGAGLIPDYMVKSSLGMVNSRLGYILMGGVGMSNVLLMRTYFQRSVPGELLEAGRVDGITDAGYLTKILIPLAKPVIAVVTLYAIVGVWNAYFQPMIYLRDPSLQPLHLILTNILNSTSVDASTIIGGEGLLAEMRTSADSMRYALIVVSTVPLLVFFGIVQKFFDEGIMLGSLKG